MKKSLTYILHGLLVLVATAFTASADKTGVESVFGDLVAIQQALAADSMEHVAHRATAIAKAAEAHTLHGLPHEAAAQAKAVAQAKDIKSAREAFKKLNVSFETYLKNHPDKTGTYHVAYCSMAKASWVQTGDTIANPYYGASMLKCGSFK